jgi:proteasome accessory factor B
MMGIEDQKVTLITYQSARATEPVTHEVYPYGLVCHRHALYLIAFDSELREVRNYKVNRIESVEVQAMKQYTRPKDFHLEAYLQNVFRIFLTVGPEQTVRVKFLPSVVRFVQEHHWHPSQILTPERDGSIIAEFRLTALEEIKSWIQSFGPNALVLEPEILRQQILSEISKLQELYETLKQQTRKSSKTTVSKAHS